MPFAVMIVGLLLVAPRAFSSATFHLYICRKHDYDRHRMACLEDVAKLGLRGKTVLSDPWTSYYTRGMTGAYVLTVIRDHASPTVNYQQRDRFVRNALLEGPEFLDGQKVDAVLVMKNDNVTSRFCGSSSEFIKSIWIKQGWKVTMETGEIIVMQPFLQNCQPDAPSM